MADPFVARVAAAWPPELWSSTTVLVAVSGGADSLALLRALAEIRVPGSSGRLAAVHFDHQWRADSGADADFVMHLCKQLKISCVTGRPDAQPHAATRDEASARLGRYEFFEKTANQLGARFLATGHTRDDQAETILHRIVRGTGLRGLAGIPQYRTLSEMTTVVRPLLDILRRDVEAFLKRQDQTWRENPSNHSTDYLRNRIRHQTLPALEQQCGAQVRSSLVRLGELACAAQWALDHQSEQLADQCVRDQSTTHCVVDCRCLADVPQAVRREWARWLWRRLGWPEQSMDRRHWEALADLAGPAPPAATANLPGPVHARRHGKRLRLQREPTPRGLPRRR